MFALIALICFILALFKVSLGSMDLVVLGLAFIALHLLWPIGFGSFPAPWYRNRPPQ